MIILDVTVVNVALPSIGTDLGLGPAGLTWVLTAYSLAFGGFMLLGGRVADVFGRGRTFVAGLALFTLASLASGIVAGGSALIAARAAQGLGAALASPAALAIIVTSFEGSERDRALGVWAALGAAGAAAGGVLGGALTSGPGWRWIFLITVPVGLAVASSIRFVLGAAADRAHAALLDLLGAVLATAAVGLLIYGLVTAGDSGWRSTSADAALIAGVAGLALFVLAERRHPAPLLRLELLARRPVASGTLLMLTASGLLVGSFFVTSLLLQRVLGVSAIETGLAFLPVAMATAAGAHICARFIGHAGARPTGVAAFALAAAGLAWMSRTPLGSGALIDVLPGFLLAAFGLGAAFVTATSTALGDVEEADAGITGSVVNTSHELGAAIGVAFVSAVAASGLDARDATTGLVHAYIAAAVVAALVAIAAARFLPAGRPSASTGRHFGH
jgi:EmrB/QacA subfamily drug resistance transporter